MLACLKVSQARSTHLTVATVADALMEQPHFICQNVYLCTLNFYFQRQRHAFRAEDVSMQNYTHICIFAFTDKVHGEMQT